MDRKGLGKGLGALISGSMADDDAASVREVPVGQIKPNPYQPRQVFDPGKLADLVASVREHGILQPVLLRRVAVDAYELIAGERRYRAAQEAGLRVVPAIIKEYANAQMLEIAIIENVQREDINAVDAAQAYKRLIDEFEMTQSDVARRVGKSQPTIANTLRLLALPDRILDGVKRNEISEGHARTLLQFAPEAQITAFETVRRRGLSVRETERLAKEIARTSGNGATPKPVEQPVRDPNHVAVEEALQIALGTKVRIRKVGGIGRIEIEFYSDDELEGVVERLIGASQ